jgi:hypothetical protein
MAYASIDEVFGSDWNQGFNDTIADEHQNQGLFDVSQSNTQNTHNTQNTQNTQNIQNLQNTQNSENTNNTQNEVINPSHNPNNPVMYSTKYPESNHYIKENSVPVNKYLEKNKYPPLKGSLLGANFIDTPPPHSDNILDMSSKNNTIFADKIDKLINVLSKNNCTNWADVVIFIVLGILCIFALEMFFKFGKFVMSQKMSGLQQPMMIPQQIPQMSQMPPISPQMVQSGGYYRV